MQNTHSAGLVLILLVSAQSLHSAPPAGCECVRVQEERKAAGGRVASVDRLVRLTNECGKDITAYRFVFSDSLPEEQGRGVAEDILGYLLGDVPNQDILRSGKSRITNVTLRGPLETASVAAVLFLDNSSAGERLYIERMLKSRKEVLQQFKEELIVLNKVRDYVIAARDLRHGALDADLPRIRSYRYVERLAEQFDRSDVASWEKYVTAQEAHLHRMIELFEAHLTAAAPRS